jgi:hypothetical protein
VFSRTGYQEQYDLTSALGLLFALPAQEFPTKILMPNWCWVPSSPASRNGRDLAERHGAAVLADREGEPQEGNDADRGLDILHEGPAIPAA